MKQSHQDKFSELYKQHSSYLYAVCLRYTKNKEDAEDVLQEGFIKIYHALDRFKGDSNIKTWMQSIMVNTAISHYRQKRRLIFQNIEEGNSEVLKIVDDKIINQLSTDELLEVINDLPEGYKMVFNLYSIEGYKHKEIAEMLEITEGTSKSQLAKARIKIQRLVKERLGITKEDAKLLVYKEIYQ